MTAEKDIVAAVPRVALVQIHVPKDATPERQLTRALDLIRNNCTTASSNQSTVDLIVLPEFWTGLPGRTDEDLIQYASSCASILQKLQTLAHELHVNIIPGSMSEMASTTNGQHIFYNTTWYIDRTGKILLKYRKVNLWGDERIRTSPGQHLGVIDTPEFGKLGLLICWDLAFPEAFRTLLRQGVQTIVIPTQWGVKDCGPKGLAFGPDSERKFINSIMTARAYENNCCIIFSNVGGPDEEDYFGCSQVTLPFKGDVLRLSHEEQVGIVEVDVRSGVLEEAERVWNIREDVTSKGWFPGVEGNLPIE